MADNAAFPSPGYVNPIPDAYEGTRTPGVTVMEPPEGSGSNVQIPSIYDPTNARPSQQAPERTGIMGRQWDQLIPFGGVLKKVENAAFDAARYVSGEGRSQYPDVPNLLETTSGLTMDGTQMLPLLVGYALNARPDQLKYLAQQALPGSELFADDQGNPMIRHEGRTFYVSKPGLRLQDLVGTFGEGAVQAASAMLTARGLPRSLASPGAIRALGLGAAQAVTQGLTKAGTGEVIRQAGGGSGADPVEIGIAAAGGGLGAIGESVVRNLAGRLQGEGAVLFQGLTGSGVTDATPLSAANLTESGRQRLAGIVTPDQLTVGQARQIQRTLGLVARESSRQPGGAAVRNAVQSAREGIPMTAGQLTGSPDQLFKENKLRFGPGKEIMDTFQADQQAALTRAAGNRLPGSGSPLAVETTAPPNPWARPTVRPGGGAPSRLELGDALELQLRQRGQQLADNEANAWSGLERATPLGERRVPDGLAFDRELASRFRARRAADRLEETVLPGSQVTQAERMMDAVLFRRDPATGILNPNAIDLGRYKQMRQALGDMVRNSTGAERRTLVRMQRGFDDVTDQMVADGMITGNPERLTQLRDAMRASREEFAFWRPDNPAAAKFMDDLQAGGKTGEQVYTALFGAGQLNANGPAHQILDHLERQFGQNSTLWADTQQAAVRSALFGNTDEAFRPQRMIAAIDKALEGPGAQIMRRLGISPDSLRELQRTARMLNQSATRNPSGTAGDLWETFRTQMSRLPLARKLVDSSLLAEAKARLATGAGRGAQLRPSDFQPVENAPRPNVGAAGSAAGAGLLPPATRERSR